MHRNTLDHNDARLRRFDAEWYARTYPDVALSSLDPAQHYLLCGIPLGRAKGPDTLLNAAARQPKDIAALFGHSDIEVLPQPEDGVHRLRRTVTKQGDAGLSGKYSPLCVARAGTAHTALLPREFGHLAAREIVTDMQNKTTQKLEPMLDIMGDAGSRPRSEQPRATML